MDLKALLAAVLLSAVPGQSWAQGVVPSGGLPLKDIADSVDAPPSLDPRSFEGVWTPAKGLFGTYVPTPPRFPVRPEAEAKIKRFIDLAAANKRVTTPHLTCRPTGVSGITALKFPAAIVQTPSKIVIYMQEDRDVYQVFLNRGHREPMKASYNGDAVGQWDGNTLVVDTVGYNDYGFVEEVFWHPASKAMHMVQRFTKSTDGRTLTIDTVLDDPTYYSAPITWQDQWTWASSARQTEYDCSEYPPEDALPFTYDNDLFRPQCVLNTSSGEGKPECVADRRRDLPAPR